MVAACSWLTPAGFLAIAPAGVVTSSAYAPLAKPKTSSPSANPSARDCSTVPDMSRPITVGNGISRYPCRAFQSAGFTDAARTRMSTSPSLGSGSGNSSHCRTSGPPVSWMTTACMALLSSAVASQQRLARWIRQALELLVGELDLERREVLPQVLERERPGDRHHGRGAAEQPRETDLAGRRAVVLGDLRDLRRIVAAQREVGHEDDPLLGAVIDDVVPPALDEAVLVLDHVHRHHRACTLDLLDRDLGDPDVVDPARLSILVQEVHRRLHLQVGVHAVLVVEVDHLRAQPFEALLELGAQPLDAAAGVVAALGRDDEAVGIPRER